MLVAVRYTERPLTQSDYTISCINKIVLLKMSTELLETCNVEDSNKHIIEEILRQVGHFPKFLKDILHFQ